MSRYRGPRVKIVRRLGALPGFTRKAPKSKSKYGSQASVTKKMSQYRIRLEEKQKLRFHYGLGERQLLKYVRIARRTKGSTGQVLLQLLEMRLDNTIFCLGMAPTIPAARQLVNHGHILVNNSRVDIPSYRCKPQDTIAVRERIRSHAIVDKNLKDVFQSKVPSHLSLNMNSYIATVNQIIDREWVGVKVNELLVVEYYSRQV